MIINLLPQVGYRGDEGSGAIDQSTPPLDPHCSLVYATWGLTVQYRYCTVPVSEFSAAYPPPAGSVAIDQLPLPLIHTVCKRHMGLTVLSYLCLNFQLTLRCPVLWIRNYFFESGSGSEFQRVLDPDPDPA
jgi:hypothetical protein